MEALAGSMEVAAQTPELLDKLSELESQNNVLASVAERLASVVNRLNGSDIKEGPAPAPQVVPPGALGRLNDALLTTEALVGSVQDSVSSLERIV